jgi:outer membrane protein assembly factor BamC
MNPKQIKPFKLLVVSSAVSVLVGCGTYQDLVEGQKVAYKQAEKRESGLDVPPDLTAQSADEQFLIPGEGKGGAVSASSYYNGSAANKAGMSRVQKSEPVLVASQDVKLKQVGKVRSLEVKMPAEQLWPKLREFWKSTGFDLTSDDPKIGLMETGWAENRAAIPMDGIRKVLGKVFDGMYSSNQRDRYRTRIEPVDGGVEVFITHRGMEENYTDKSQSNLQWMNRPNDPELEAEMLNRLMVKLTGDEQAAKIQAGTLIAPKELIALKKEAAGTSLVLAEDFPQAWRRVGFGLDRAGFIVEDRDRSNGTYYVKYAPDSASQDGNKKTGFFGSLFGGSKDKSLKEDQRFQVILASKTGQDTTVTFMSERGAAVDPQVSDEAANRLAQRLRQ